MSDDIEEIATEARKTFDLSDRLKKRRMRTDTQKVYTDEVLGNKLGWVKEVTNNFGMVVDTEHVGILGQIAEAKAADSDADVSKLREAAIDLKMELEQSALTFHLQAVPPIVAKVARRKARKVANVTGKNLTDEQTEDLTDAYMAQILSSVIVKVVDFDESESGALSVEQAGDLKDSLPPSEYEKLAAKLNDVQYRQAVGDQITADADF